MNHNITINESELILEYQGSKNKSEEQYLNAALNLCSVWILVHKLNDCDKLISEIYDKCIERNDNLKFKAVQFKSFLRFKQARFPEALELMLYQKEIMGPSVELCENMGHVYNALGQNDKAFLEFSEALNHSIDQNSTGGIFVGLGQSRKNCGDFKSALSYYEHAQKLYEKKFTHQHQLVAKVLLYKADCHFEMENYTQAELDYRESIKLFMTTSDENSSLTSTSWIGLSNLLFKTNRHADAVSCIKLALNQEIKYQPLRMNNIYKLIEPLDKNKLYGVKFSEILIRIYHICKNDDDILIGMTLKIIGFIVMIEGDSITGKLILNQALKILKSKNGDMGLRGNLSKIINEVQYLINS